MKVDVTGCAFMNMNKFYVIFLLILLKSVLWASEGVVVIESINDKPIHALKPQIQNAIQQGNSLILSERILFESEKLHTHDVLGLEEEFPYILFLLGTALKQSSVIMRAEGNLYGASESVYRTLGESFALLSSLANHNFWLANFLGFEDMPCLLANSHFYRFWQQNKYVFQEDHVSAVGYFKGLRTHQVGWDAGFSELQMLIHQSYFAKNIHPFFLSLTRKFIMMSDDLTSSEQRKEFKTFLEESPPDYSRFLEKVNQMRQNSFEKSIGKTLTDIRTTGRPLLIFMDQRHFEEIAYRLRDQFPKISIQVKDYGEIPTF